jgi:hypothetical protein
MLLFSTSSLRLGVSWWVIPGGLVRKIAPPRASKYALPKTPVGSWDVVRPPDIHYLLPTSY